MPPLLPVQIEAELRKLDERLRFVAERAEVCYWDWDLEPDRLEWSPLCNRLLGIPVEDPLSYGRFLAAVHPDDRERIELAVRACLESDGERSFDIEYRTLWPDGTVRWIHGRGSATFDGAKPVRMAGIALDVTEHKLVEEAASHLAAIVGSSSDAILSEGLDGIITSWNRGAETLFGYRAPEIIGLPYGRLIPSERLAEASEHLARIAAGEDIQQYETVRLHKDGRPIAVSVTISPIRGKAGKVTGACKIVRDISERKKAEERAQLLLHEVHHRSKNLLNLVQVIARHTASTSPEDFINRFGERIEALAAGQDLLVKNEWKGVQLSDLVRSQLAHFADAIGARILLAGPPIMIASPAAQTLGMALHELATNAGKYGALSSAQGIIGIEWDLRQAREGSQRFTIAWSESGGPPVQSPNRQGFGSTVIGSMIEIAFGCSPVISFEPPGFSWRVECDAAKVITEAA